MFHLHSQMDTSMNIQLPTVSELIKVQRQMLEESLCKRRTTSEHLGGGGPPVLLSWARSPQTAQSHVTLFTPEVDSKPCKALGAKTERKCFGLGNDLLNTNKLKQVPNGPPVLRLPNFVFSST